MKTLQTRYRENQNPFVGDIPKIRMAIVKGDTKTAIRNLFDRVVPVDDFAFADKQEILEDLYSCAI